MKIVINGAYGGYGYGVANKFRKLVDKYKDDRTNSELVNFVEQYPHKCGDLIIKEIPNTATDWEIDEYDGWENITYVVDGKIYH